mmetsp:Transcript_10585/g.27202  ORF Transcript_10585/g.27202 Transcript_10585/m.27202 type:complete len:612 (+) Transcript_10585:302-2137(+)
MADATAGGGARARRSVPVAEAASAAAPTPPPAARGAPVIARPPSLERRGTGFTVWDADSTDDDADGGADNESTDSDDEFGGFGLPKVTWRVTPRAGVHNTREPSKRAGGMYKAEGGTIDSTSSLSYSLAYSDDSDDEWGFGSRDSVSGRGHDSRVSGVGVQPASATDTAGEGDAADRGSSAAKGLGRFGGARLGDRSRDGESDDDADGVGMAYIEEHFDFPPGEAAEGGGDEGRLPDYPAPTAKVVMVLLALDPERQAALVASLYDDHATAAYQQLREEEEDVAEAARLTQAEETYGESADAYYHSSNAEPPLGTAHAAAFDSERDRLASLSDYQTMSRKQTLQQHFTEAVYEAGWLEKRGGGTRVLGNTRYKRRWFELVRTVKGLYLTYQVEPGDGMLKGAIKMSKVHLQSDTGCKFSLHVDNASSGDRRYHVKAGSIEEKFTWLRAIDSLMPVPQQNADMFKGRDLPLLSGWLKTHVVGGRRPLRAKDRWIQLWDKGQNRGPFLAFLDSPSDSRPLLELPLKDAVVIDDKAVGSEHFSVMVLGADVRFGCFGVSKSKWLQPLASHTEGGIVLEKNSGRRATVVTLSHSPEAAAPSVGSPVLAVPEDVEC